MIMTGQDLGMNSQINSHAADSCTNIETVALVVDEPGADFKLQQVVFDEVQPDEYLIEMKYSGICHTDIIMQQNLFKDICEYPAIFGHEGAGIVKAIGSDIQNASIKVGDAVLLSFASCRDCEECQLGNPAGCWNYLDVNFPARRYRGTGSVAKSLSDGRSVSSMFFGQSSFSKLSLVRKECVVKYEYDDLESLALYAAAGCGIQTGAASILNLLKPRAEQSVVVFGLGTVGLTALMAAKYLKVHQIIAIDIVESKLSLARELGATHTINSSLPSIDVVAEIKKITQGGASYALECTGIVPVLEKAMDCIRPFGTALTIGAPPAGSLNVKIDVLSFIVSNKIYRGTNEGGAIPSEFIPKLVKMHKEGNFPIEKIVTKYPVVDFQRALRDLKDGNAVKAVICWDE